MPTILSAIRRPKPNLRLTGRPTPFLDQSGSCFSGSQLDVHTTMCCTSRQVNFGLRDITDTCYRLGNISPILGDPSFPPAPRSALGLQGCISPRSSGAQYSGTCTRNTSVPREPLEPLGLWTRNIIEEKRLSPGKDLPGTEQQKIRSSHERYMPAMI